MAFFIRLEIFGHYLEIGQTAGPEEVTPAPEGTQYPLTVFAEPVGFRIIGDGYEIATDHDASDG